MQSNSSSTSLVIGLALVVAGVGLYRRHRAGAAAGLPEDEIEADAGTGAAEPMPGADPPHDRDADPDLHSTAPEAKRLPQFFLLVFVLAVPFWLWGGGKLPLPINLPTGALVTFVPVIAASLVSYKQYGFIGVKELLKKAFDYKKIKNKLWYLPTLLLMPLISFLSYAVMRLAGLPLPDSVQIPFLIVPIFFVMFFIGDAGEELGWTGYAIDPMQNRWGAWKAGLILGVVWAIWHIIPWVQTGNSANWIAWKSLSAVALRILIVWTYNNTGRSVFAAILLHDMVNLSEFLFPNYGSHFDPFVSGLITWITVVIVLLGWGPKTKPRDRHASVSP